MTALFTPSINIQGNQLTSPVISQLLEDIDASGSVNGTFDSSGNPGSIFGSLTPAGQAAHASLIIKGWSISL